MRKTSERLIDRKREKRSPGGKKVGPIYLTFCIEKFLLFLWIS